MSYPAPTWEKKRRFLKQCTAPDIAGKDLANPTALLLSAVMMLHHLGERTAAGRIEAALDKVLQGPGKATRDIGGKASTTEFTDAIIAAL